MFQQTLGIFLDSSGSPYTYHQNQPIMEVNIQISWIRHGSKTWICLVVRIRSHGTKTMKSPYLVDFFGFFQASNKQIQENVQILQVRNLQGSKSPPFTSICGDVWNFFSNRIQEERVDMGSPKHNEEVNHTRKDGHFWTGEKFDE